MSKTGISRYTIKPEDVADLHKEIDSLFIRSKVRVCGSSDNIKVYISEAGQFRLSIYVCKGIKDIISVAFRSWGQLSTPLLMQREFLEQLLKLHPKSDRFYVWLANKSEQAWGRGLAVSLQEAKRQAVIYAIGLPKHTKYRNTKNVHKRELLKEITTRTFNELGGVENGCYKLGYLKLRKRSNSLQKG